MKNKVKIEIEELHQFFMDYFNGKIPGENISRFTDVLKNDFQLITPRAEKFGYQEIIDMIKSSYNSRDDMKIWTENIEARNLSDKHIIATYNELQGHENTTNRLSTAIFERDESTINGLRWVHVHETWIQ